MYFNGGFRTDLAALRASVVGGFVHDMNSWQLNPQYQSATDLHLNASSQLMSKAMPLASVTVDVDGQARSATAPTIGADELAAAPRYTAHQQAEVKVYPNPFRQELKVEVAGLEGQVQVTLVDMMGREVYSRSCNASVGALTVAPQVQLPQGVYLLKVSNNGSTGTYRVVKQ